MVQYIQSLMGDYGYYVLGLMLLLELLALPLPGEVIMMYTGLLVFQGHLNWFLSILIAGTGTSLGITISYWIGYKLGTPFFERHGDKIHFGPEQLKKTAKWFDQYGNKLLTIAFFIPGVRHFTGYFSGITRMSFRTFMWYAYSGAFLWTGTFISLGKVLGPKWELYHKTITKYMLIGGIIAVLIFIIVYVIRKYRNQIWGTIVFSLRKGLEIFHTLGRVKVLVVLSLGAFFLCFVLILGLIQDFLANEFSDFDAVTTFIIQASFNENWTTWMHGFGYLASLPVLLTLCACSVIWVILKGENRRLEIFFLLAIIVGGELWEEGLRRLFHRIGPVANMNTFPSEQTLITVIFLGFVTYLFVRHTGNGLVQTTAFSLVVIVALLIGLSRVYFGIQYPSDVIAGYVFGGLWLSLHIILLEIFRFLNNNRDTN